jgi:hypothetical protein
MFITSTVHVKNKKYLLIEKGTLFARLLGVGENGKFLHMRVRVRTLTHTSTHFLEAMII